MHKHKAWLNVCASPWLWKYIACVYAFPLVSCRADVSILLGLDKCRHLSNTQPDFVFSRSSFFPWELLKEKGCWLDKHGGGGAVMMVGESCYFRRNKSTKASFVCWSSTRRKKKFFSRENSLAWSEIWREDWDWLILRKVWILSKKKLYA